MQNLVQYPCPICGKPFTEADDVVVCPHCGAPHHRECWMKNGRCAHAAFHGTARQWRPAPVRGEDDAVVCGNCGMVNRTEDTVCAKCGHVLEEAPPVLPAEQLPPIDASVFYADFSPYIGIASDSTLDGLPVMELAAFFGPHPGFYLSRFYFMQVQKTTFSWNWAAALFPALWVLYRKMYRWFVPVLLLSLLSVTPYLYAVGSGMTQLLSGAVSSASIPTWMLLWFNAATTLSFFFRATMASVANHLYRRHTLHTITAIKQAHEDPVKQREAFTRRGGVSVLPVALFLAAVLVLALTWLAVRAWIP